MIVRARVRKGRLVVEKPTDLPEGVEVALQTVDDVLANELPNDERAMLEASIETARGWWIANRDKAPRAAVGIVLAPDVL